MPAERVVRVLGQVLAWRGQLQAIRLDTGPEFLAERLISWCTEGGANCVILIEGIGSKGLHRGL